MRPKPNIGSIRWELHPTRVSVEEAVVVVAVAVVPGLSNQVRDTNLECVLYPFGPPLLLDLFGPMHWMGPLCNK